MSLLDADLTEESITTFNLDDFTEHQTMGGCDCGCGGTVGGCDGCMGGDEDIVGGVDPRLVVPLVGLGLLIVGVLIVVYFYYSDEADPAGWIPDMSPETKYWGARAGAITGMVGLTTMLAVPFGYFLKTTKLWGFALALIIIGIIILVVSFTYGGWMIDVFGPVDEDAAFWAKVAGGVIMSVGLLPFIGKALFVGGKTAVKFKGRMDQYRAASTMYDEAGLDMKYKDDEPEANIYEPESHSNKLDTATKLYSQNKSQIDQLVSRGMSKLKKG